MTETVTIGTDTLLKHLGHLLAVNGNLTPGIAPNGEAGLRLTAIVLHCQDCDADIGVLTMPTAPLHMTGTTVIWYEHEPTVPDDYASGWVAHAVLSDGTLSWPMGAGTYPNKADAETDATRIAWTSTGPVLSGEGGGHE